MRLNWINGWDQTQNRMPPAVSATNHKGGFAKTMSSTRLIVIFFLYGLTIYFSQLVLSIYSPSASFEILISWAAAPLQILVFPWLDLLETMNMTEGDWIKAPTFLGLIIVLTGYSVLVLAFTRLVKVTWRMWRQ